MFKNSRKTKAYKAEWLEYIENVEIAKDESMRLQYIYEVFRIEVLSENAFDKFIKAHYPSEVDSLNLCENEQSYHSMLLDYVVQNAQKKRDKRLEFESRKLTMDEDTIEVLAMFNMTEDEFFAQNQEMEMRKELTPYEVLLKSDKYVDCIRNLHIQLHGMSTIDSKRIIKVQQMNDEQNRTELERLGLSNLAEVEGEKSVKNEISYIDESSLYDNEQLIELTEGGLCNQYQTMEAPNENIFDNIVEKRVITEAEPYIGFYNLSNEILDDEEMEDIRNEFREYEEKHGDKAMEFMRLDSVIRELTREVTTEESIAEFKQKLQREKETERKEREKLFEGGQPVKWERTTNNPLEHFYRLREGRIDKEDS